MKTLELLFYPKGEAASPAAALATLYWLLIRVWEEKCTNALRSGMCVLQEAKLAALVSKRWEHQLERTGCADSLRGLWSRAVFTELCSWGPQETSSPTQMTKK